ncbi:MAG TPA: alkaline phosphatase family protein [Solirubrobacteraceae bacterium]|jgi:phospholipase C|nr:alkaline phosphatase family protein [Solirubrobacteraceae bacterium]
MARKRMLSLVVAVLSVSGLAVAVAQAHAGRRHHGASSRHQFPSDGGKLSTTTPIKHLVVIFQENVSFDHYFATYPDTAPASGDQPFRARPDTPSVNGLNTPLLAPNNPNSAQPFLLHHSQAYTCDQDHDYTAEQQAFDAGLMDKFPEFAGSQSGNPGCDYGHGKGLVMGYYDGGTTTALWNYAQHFAMSDNSYGTNFGPSTVGALNLVSGQTHGASGPSTEVTAGSVTGDPQPSGDVCTNRDNVTMSGRNIGNLLNDKGVTWGWFNGGFHTADGKPACSQTHIGADGNPKTDYIPHHEPFQYYASTANPNHLPPTSVAMIGHQGDQANHQYDLTDFWAALAAHNLPAVSFLKAPGYQDGHAGYSSPLLEQQFLVDTINRLEKSSDWSSTAVVIAYDDSDGWYDHQMSPIVNGSQTSADALSGPGQCGTNAPSGGYQGRCGYGPRLPLLVVSPFAKANYVDGTTTDQSSITRFIEDNWNTGRIGDASFDAKAGSLDNMFTFRRDDDGPKLFLDPSTGQPAGFGDHGHRDGPRHR